MKELMLIRHGKSSWHLDVEDKDRPLKDRGIRDGHRMARALRPDFPMPDAVYSSPANRALHTCMILMRGLQIPMERLRITEALYDFSGSSVRDFAESLDDGLGRVLLFGHNNAFTALANSWGDRPIDNVPTTGFVRLRFDTGKWAGLTEGTTVRTLFPKDLK